MQKTILLVFCVVAYFYSEPLSAQTKKEKLFKAARASADQVADSVDEYMKGLQNIEKGLTSGKINSGEFAYSFSILQKRLSDCSEDCDIKKIIRQGRLDSYAIYPVDPFNPPINLFSTAFLSASFAIVEAAGYYLLVPTDLASHLPVVNHLFKTAAAGSIGFVANMAAFHFVFMKLIPFINKVRDYAGKIQKRPYRREIENVFYARLRERGLNIPRNGEYPSLPTPSGGFGDESKRSSDIVKALARDIQTHVKDPLDLKRLKIISEGLNNYNGYRQKYALIDIVVRNNLTDVFSPTEIIKLGSRLFVQECSEALPR